MNDNYKSPCSCAFFAYLLIVVVAVVGCVATAALPAAPQAIQYFGGTVVLPIFIVALAWALRRK